MDGLRVWWWAFRHLEHRGYIYVWANLCWVALSLPIITAPAAWAGLARMSHAAHTSRFADLNDFWQGFRENLGRGVVLAVVNALVLLVNLSNLYSYQEETGLLVGIMRLCWIVALLFWFSIQLYMWTLFYEMENPTLWGAVRNAAVMVYLNPLFTLSLWVLIIPLVILSTALPALWILLSGSLFATLGTTAVLDRLQKAGYHRPEAAASTELGTDLTIN